MSETPRRSRGRRLVRRTAFAIGGSAGLLALAGAGGGVWLHHRLDASLPLLDGRRAASGLTAPVTIERDALGIPTLAGASRRDVAYATGFVHAQDRFFQMDLLRRRAAGELAELLGERALADDRALRAHLFRRQAQRVVAAGPPEVRALLASYTDGVNAGLAALGAPPFEYALLRAAARPWRPEDTVLALLSMFIQLEDVNGTEEGRVSLMHDLLPGPLVTFLLPQGTEWDAPLEGAAFASPPVPQPGAVDVAALARAAALQPAPAAPPRLTPAASGKPASNAWAVAGGATASGGAVLADELHLALTVPNLWYRAAFEWPDGSGRRRRVTGATLPGIPAVVVGSNGRVAWGVTNSAVDTSDLILLDVDPRRPGFYRTPEGWRAFDHQEEVLHLRGGGEETLPVDWTVWGPVVGKDHRGVLRAVHAVADDPGAVDLAILRLETAETVAQALDVARQSGLPALNFLAADAAGHIGWTILGRVPRRVGLDGQVAEPWADGSRRWDGLLPPAEVPAVTDPAAGRLWSANNREVGGDRLDRLGHWGYMLGARARQIRDDLAAIPKATAEDMRKIQLDDRALFFERWQKLLLSVLTPQATAADPRRRELREVVAAWGDRAAVGSAGFRMVRSYRILLARDIFGALTAPCRKADPEFDYTALADQYEGPLWRLVSERPLHLLNAKYKSWDQQLLAGVDSLLALFPDGPLRDRTWGERNTTSISHLLSPALPGLRRWLDMPAEQLPGADNMPRVQDPDFGSTLRMVVSPGREAEGYFHMPAGQSGNPLSPHYRDAHQAWAEGAATPFLPGPSRHRLILTPRGPS